ncbi:MAG: monovalent cation/H(+) antiporter subunit G [Firmicutes bacterium]|nr:monovalent cation/H(+) antiporter subunit G [Bacillota bacterium]
MSNWIKVLGLSLIYLGSAFALVAALGVLRLDACARFHACTKTTTLGILCVALGGTLYMGTWDYGVRFLLIALLFLILNPTGTRAVVRAGHRMGLKSQGDTASQRGVELCD